MSLVYVNVKKLWNSTPKTNKLFICSTQMPHKNRFLYCCVFMKVIVIEASECDVFLQIFTWNLQLTHFFCIIAWLFLLAFSVKCVAISVKYCLNLQTFLCKITSCVYFVQTIVLIWNKLPNFICRYKLRNTIIQIKSERKSAPKAPSKFNEVIQKCLVDRIRDELYYKKTLKEYIKFFKNRNKV